jgi:hypothetical protein
MSEDVTVDAAGNNPSNFKQDKRDGFYYWTPEGVGAKDGYLSPQEQAELRRHDEELRKKAQWRAETCCWVNCNRPAVEWIVEVKFDLKHLDAATDRTATIDTGAMKAELPGFCSRHRENLPTLVQQIFYMQPQTWFGFKPTRWIATFLDGSSKVGNIEQVLLPIQHQVTDTLIREDSTTN